MVNYDQMVSDLLDWAAAGRIVLTREERGFLNDALNSPKTSLEEIRIMDLYAEESKRLAPARLSGSVGSKMTRRSP